MKKVFYITILTVGLPTLGFSQSNCELKASNQTTNSVKIKKELKKLKRKEANARRVKQERNFNPQRDRVLRDPINRNLYNEQFRGSLHHRYNNRPINL